MEPFFKGCSTKIDQKTYGKIHQAEISQQLFAVNRRHLLYGFQLNHHSPLYQQINSKPIIKTDAVILEADRFLPLDRQSTPRQDL
jgi:hypothetical protein